MIKVIISLLTIGTPLILYSSQQQIPEDHIDFTIPQALQIIALKKTSPTNPSPENQHVKQLKHRRSSSSSGKIQTQGIRTTPSPSHEPNTRRMST